MRKGCASVRICWLSVQVLSGWDTLQSMALVVASRRGDATGNGYGKRGTVENMKRALFHLQITCSLHSQLCKESTPRSFLK